MNASVKRFFKRNSHNSFFKALAGFGRSLNRFYENRNHDVSSNGELMIVKKLAQFEPKIIFDGGANVGKYALILDEILPKCKIYAFEPVKDTFTKLVENVKAYDNIIPVNFGLYSSSCTKEIQLFESDTHSSIYDIKGVGYESMQKQKIELITINQFAQQHNIEEIDFIKLDLEGAEYDAIVGLMDLLQDGRVRVIQFEYGYINISTRKLLIDFYTIFENHGYVVGKIFPRNVEFRKYEVKFEDFIGPNFIAVHKNERQLIELLERKHRY